ERRAPRRIFCVRSLSKNFSAHGRDLPVWRSLPESECKGRNFLDNGKIIGDFFSKKEKKDRKRIRIRNKRGVLEAFEEEEEEACLYQMLIDMG
ncbi:MAG: hypothetical protein J1F40_07360, partial [Prevotellaceae bacterium]|nr:hypothetical protein [Prevotellaceae bacterium]